MHKYSSNPFLYNDNEEDEKEEETSDSLNPFISTNEGIDNPFLIIDDNDQKITTGINPFAIESVTPEETSQNFDKLTSNIFHDFENETNIQDYKRPQPKELILSVTGTLDQTTSNLLNNIPLTRSPSPISIRDITSPDNLSDTDNRDENLVNLSDDLHSVEKSPSPPIEKILKTKIPPSRPPPPIRPSGSPALQKKCLPAAPSIDNESIVTEIFNNNQKEIEEYPINETIIPFNEHITFKNSDSELFTNLISEKNDSNLKTNNMEINYKDTEEIYQSQTLVDILDKSEQDTDIINESCIYNENPFSTQNNEQIFRDTFVVAQEAEIEIDEFEKFEAKFDNVECIDSHVNDIDDPFKSKDVWGNAFDNTNFNQNFANGFGMEESFETFLAKENIQQESSRKDSLLDDLHSIDQKNQNPFEFKSDSQLELAENKLKNENMRLSFDSQQISENLETPPTPLFDEDTSQPLEDFPRTKYKDDIGWEMYLRQPNKKKITGQRFWKKIFVKIVYQNDVPVLQLFNTNIEKEAFQELPLQPCYSVSEISAQQYDVYGKIFTVKVQYIFYKERPGVRPGQVSKAEKLTSKLSKFASYAMAGDYEGCKEFGSDLKKLGLPVEHSPQITELMKIGSLNYEDMKTFSVAFEEFMFNLSAFRDKVLTYKMEEIQLTAVDEIYVEQNSQGCVDKQIARVRLFILAFLTGMPDIDIGINDIRRQGKEVVGRHDIIAVPTEEWIRIENVEFHACIQQDTYHETHMLRIKPPDACYIEFMRFRIRPPKNRELPLQLKAVISIIGKKIELRADILVPGFTSRKLGQIPCEDVVVRFPIPECWIYLFRVEKHFRYGSVKSAHRRTGKVKGIERFLGAVETLQESLIEVTSGQAKYEHQYRAIVWRIARLPKEGQGAYTTHNMVVKIVLTSYDQFPEKLADYCYVEFTMPMTQVSHTMIRSISLQNTDSDEPPEKFVRHLSRHEYRVQIEQVEGENIDPYAAATMIKTQTEHKEKIQLPEIPQSDSSSESE